MDSNRINFFPRDFPRENQGSGKVAKIVMPMSHFHADGLDCRTRGTSCLPALLRLEAEIELRLRQKPCSGWPVSTIGCIRASLYGPRRFEHASMTDRARW